MAIEILLFLGSVAGPIYFVLFLLVGALLRHYGQMLLTALFAGLSLGALFSARNWSSWVDFGQAPLALTLESLVIRVLTALIVCHVLSKCRARAQGLPKSGCWIARCAQASVISIKSAPH